MTLIGRSVIAKFSKDHADARVALQAFVNTIELNLWSNLMELRASYPSTDLVGECYVFNIKGNRYRLVAKINFAAQLISVCDVMTHAKYSKGGWKNGCNC